MLNTLKRYLKVKRQAMSLMLNGDVERYMRKLREMHELQPRTGGVAA